MKATICVGISGSGKSTWADNEAHFAGCAELSMNPETVVINRDETRWALSGKKGWNGDNAYKFHSEIEDSVTVVNLQKIYDAAIEGKDIIIADTNLNPKTRNSLIGYCINKGYEVEIKEFPISFQEACKRDAQRGIFSVGETILMKQWEQWVKYFSDKEEKTAQQYYEEKGEGMWE